MGLVSPTARTSQNFLQSMPAQLRLSSGEESNVLRQIKLRPDELHSTHNEGLKDLAEAPGTICGTALLLSMRPIEPHWVIHE